MLWTLLGGAQSIMLVKQCGRKEERNLYIYIDDSKIGSMPFFEKSLNFAEPYT